MFCISYKVASYIVQQRGVQFFQEFWKLCLVGIITLAISKCYGKVRVLLFFPRDNSVISAGKSHSSGVRGLVVRCLLLNPEVSCSNRCVCLPFHVRYDETLPIFGSVKLFLKISPKDLPFNCFDILQHGPCFISGI